MYRQIEIVGMRKNRDVKIVITIIILAIIGIIACSGIILYEKSKLHQEVATSAESMELENTEQNSGQITETPKETVTGKEESEQKNKEFINAINNIYNGNEGKRVFLTFDDGPTKEVTPYILDVLDKYNVKATFFVLGVRVNQNPDILKRAYNSGHYIANHGYSHKYSSIYKSADTVLEEYNKTESLIKNVVGQNYSSNLFRFPGGAHGGPYEEIKKEAREKLNENGIAYLDWSALTYDSAGASKT